MSTNSESIVSKYTRVSRAHKCPICRHAHWCLISRDNRLVICARITSDKRAGQAGWLHKLDGSQPILIPPAPSVKQAARVSSEVIDHTYRHLLSALRLDSFDRDSLHQRGLSDDEITLLNLKTLPHWGRDDIVSRLQRQNCQLQGVPGFFTADNGRWRLAGSPGIAIPVQDIKRRISGIQIRRRGDLKPKYIWLSSKDKPSGCGSGTPIHVTWPEDAATDEVWITEGPLKADIASLRLKRIVLAVPGVANYRGVIPILKSLKPHCVVLAYDMDKKTNPVVKTYENYLKGELLDANFLVYETEWSTAFKGLDDLLKGDSQP
jgi:hypothetical protein